ncbi:hypothetical protein IKW75_02675 [Candidatus Saccharibacteria bacterium]|nr:hypothetical protein [Candidatus Saccharibacteria bacterium]
MDKEGQSIQFSSDAISEKKKPDFFIASNEKAARRERFSIKTIFAKIGRFFKKLGVKFVGYTKHPFRGKHKILTISLFVVIVVAVVLIVLNLTIWQKTAKDTTPLSDEELESWNSELSKINTEAQALSDDDMKSFYTNHINDEKREYKALDLTLDYARMLSTKGFVDDAAAILNALDTDDLSCRQMIEYYAGFFSIYDMINNGSWSSELDYYADLIDNQISICDTGEPLPVEDATVEEAQNEE